MIINMSNFSDEKPTQICFKDNYGNVYSYDDLLNMSFEQLDALEKGQPVNITQNSSTLDKSKTQEKGRQKTLGLHPQMRRGTNSTKTTIVTIILAISLFLSGFFASYFNFLI